MGGGVAVVPQIAEHRFGAGEGVAAHGYGRAVELHVEARELRHHQGMIEPSEKTFVHGMGKIIVVEKPGLDLEAENVALVLEPAPAIPVLGHGGLRPDALGEARERLGFELHRCDFFTHGSCCRPATLNDWFHCHVNPKGFRGKA